MIEKNKPTRVAPPLSWHQPTQTPEEPLLAERFK